MIHHFLKKDKKNCMSVHLTLFEHHFQKVLQYNYSLITNFLGDTLSVSLIAGDA